jgi:hypothetical protein
MKWIGSISPAISIRCRLEPRSRGCAMLRNGAVFPMNRLLIVAILVICTVPLYARAQQPDAAKLKADAQKVVSVIKGDKAKIQAYCQINELAEQIGEADQEKDSKKAEALSRQIFELEIKLGPDYLTLVSGLKDIDPNSPQGQEINSILAPLDDSCED